MMPAEIHTGDLTANCLRAVQLRHEGKIIGETPTAMLRGLLAGEALALWHNAGRPVSECVGNAMAKCEEQAQAERRPITSGARKAIDDIRGEVARAMETYVAAWDRSAVVLGCEVPVRMTIDVDGEPVEFASHIDLLYRLGGKLIVDDWKWYEVQSTAPYLARHAQLGLYCWAIRHGSVEIDGTWHALGEWPQAGWVDLAAHLPYRRAGSYTDQETGEVVPVAKGDIRPSHVRRRVANITEAGLPAIRAEFSLRVRMMRHGLWPTRPDPIGCHVCASRIFCPDFSGRPVAEA